MVPSYPMGARIHQTVFDKDITIRMFRYSFERAVKLDYYREKNKIRLKFPEPYIILIEEENNVSDELTMEIEIPKREIFSFKVKVLKYWQYDLNKLYEENMYLLYPIQIFGLRKAMKAIKDNAGHQEERQELYKQLKAIILKTLEAIDKAYKDARIELEDYDEMTTVLVNLNNYLLNVYKLEGEVEKETQRLIIFAGL